MAHWFNHQTHHRGQVHAMLNRVSGEAPELDLLIYQRQLNDKY
ncbi:DinB family protein [Klebsiella variicola]|nr:DinB family protein [Klebsiella variicola]